MKKPIILLSILFCALAVSSVQPRIYYRPSPYYYYRPSHYYVHAVVPVVRQEPGAVVGTALGLALCAWYANHMEKRRIRAHQKRLEIRDMEKMSLEKECIRAHQKFLELKHKQDMEKMSFSRFWNKSDYKTQVLMLGGLLAGMLILIFLLFMLGIKILGVRIKSD